MAIVLRIEKLVHGGLGIAHGSDGIVFVSGVIPGELVEVEVMGRRARCDFARTLTIIEPSPFRREPFCPHVGVCGGCDWQHIRYEKQVELKREILEECFRRHAKLEHLPAIEIYTGPETSYRMRAQFQVSRLPGIIGFFERGSNRLVPIEMCPLLVPELNRFLNALRECLERAPDGVERVAAIAGSHGQVASRPVFHGLSCTETMIDVSGISFRVAGDSFFQNNRHLVAGLANWPAERVTGTHCLDLYGGAGFFSAFLAPRFSSVYLVEQVSALAAQAQDTFTRHGFIHCRAIQAPVEKFLRETTTQADCVIVDPPRQGLTRTVVDCLVDRMPQTIVYVSCDPATMARDVGRMIWEGAYFVHELALFDLYPNTHHVEAVALLRRK